MWCCSAGLAFPDVSKERYAFNFKAVTVQPFKEKALRFFETSGNTNPAQHRHISNDPNPKKKKNCCGNLKSRTALKLLRPLDEELRSLCAIYLNISSEVTRNGREKPRIIVCNLTGLVQVPCVAHFGPTIFFRRLLLCGTVILFMLHWLTLCRN
jgi:hypothetical protein